MNEGCDFAPPNVGVKTNLLCISLFLLVASCSQTLKVNVDAEVPVVVMRALPLTVATYFDSELRTHVYSEDNDDRQGWAISSGSSQVAMFDKVIASAFSDYVVLDQLPTNDTPAASDLVIVPKIIKMQIATPEETFFRFYEAWIQYDVTLMTPNGETVSSWEITAYGKAPDGRFTTRTGGLNQAIGLALRDCGAKLSSGMRKQPLIRKLLQVVQ